MKATLIFDLPEELEDLLSAMYGNYYLSCLHDLDRDLRGKAKYEGKETVSIDEVRRMIRDCGVGQESES